ncbi:MAG: hypothetical protein AB1393_12335 [Candidatus Edwardsbacteria bacterium]
MKRKHLLGEILVELGAVSVEQINEARRRQMLYNSNKKLGEWLLELQYLNTEQLQQALRIQRAE